jgi:S-adenosylmethionine hydrolase
MIVLLTDFGQSEYVGVMKGVIHSLHAEARIVDLCHDLRPQSIVEASWILKNNYRYFPRGAVFCCVVDPGVGTTRKAIAVRTESYCFVAPDNGLLWETLREQEIVAMRELPVPADASRTFHGRDVFAKAAARIDLGHFDELGDEIKTIREFVLYLKGREGIVVRIDRFGNIITNVPPLDKTEYTVTIEGRQQTMPFCPTYDAAPDNELFLITGSCNTLEISLKNNNANERLHVAPGKRITIS